MKINSMLGSIFAELTKTYGTEKITKIALVSISAAFITAVAAANVIPNTVTNNKNN